MTTVLLTGFEPFGGDATNPSGEAVHLVSAAWNGPETLITAVLPVTFDASSAHLERLIDEHRPDVVISVGLAGGIREIEIERVAVNLIDARIPDNDGRQPIDAPSIPGAPAAQLSTLPVKAIVAAVTAAGIPCTLSLTAGTFVCNHVFFAATTRAAEAGTRAGFIHVPWDDEHAPEGSASLPLTTIADAIGIAVRTAASTDVDVRTVGGALH